MIIGNGLIAKKFTHYSESCDYLIFASGVSNSSNTEKTHFEREESLLRESLRKHSSKIFVYFSSCDIECLKVKETLYYQHKIKMEEIVKNSARKFYIFRLPQVVGKGGNSKTLINFFILNILEGREFNVFTGTYKNILDIGDAYKICDYILKHDLFQNETVNIINNFYFKIEDIVEKIEIFLGKKAIFKPVTNKNFCKYTNIVSEKIISKIDINFDEEYIERLLAKYYDKNRSLKISSKHSIMMDRK